MIKAIPIVYNPLGKELFPTVKVAKVLVEFVTIWPCKSVMVTKPIIERNSIQVM